MHQGICKLIAPILGLMLAVGAGAQTAIKPPVTQEQAAQIKAHQNTGKERGFLTKEQIDLGQIREGKIAETEVVVNNRSDKPFKITEVQTSCPCATVELPKDPAQLTVAPGQSLKIPTKYDTKGRFGGTGATIVISTDMPEQPFLIAEIALFVQVLVVTQPEKAVVWGLSPRGYDLKKTLSIRPGTIYKEMELIDIRMKNPGVTVATETTKNKDGLPIIRAKFHLEPDVPLGQYENEVQAKLRVGPEETTVTMPFRGMVIGDVLVTPPAINSPDISYIQGQRISEITVQSSTGGAPPDVLGAVAVGPLRVVIHKNAKPGKHLIEVQAAENVSGGPQSGMIHVMTASADEPIITVPIYYLAAFRVGARPAQVLLTPAEGKPSSQEIKIYDASGAPVNVKDVRFESDLLQAQVTKPAGVSAEDPATVTVSATAVPTDPGRAATMIAVVTDAPGAEALQIPVLIRAPLPAKEPSKNVATLEKAPASGKL